MTEATQKTKPRIWSSILPLFIFLGIAGASYSLLSTEGRDVSALPSALIDKPAPNLSVPALQGLIENGEQIPGMTEDASTKETVQKMHSVSCQNWATLMMLWGSTAMHALQLNGVFMVFLRLSS